MAKFPHALYAGSTRSGKTIGLRCLVVSVAATQPVEKLNMIIIDTGANDLDLFGNLPHLSYPIVKDEDVALCVMIALRNELNRRMAFSREELRLMPALVCVIDEYMSLINANQGLDLDLDFTGFPRMWKSRSG